MKCIKCKGYKEVTNQYWEKTIFLAGSIVNNGNCWPLDELGIKFNIDPLFV